MTRQEVTGIEGALLSLQRASRILENLDNGNLQKAADYLGDTMAWLEKVKSGDGTLHGLR